MKLRLSSKRVLHLRIDDQLPELVRADPLQCEWIIHIDASTSRTQSELCFISSYRCASCIDVVTTPHVLFFTDSLAPSCASQTQPYPMHTHSMEITQAKSGWKWCR